MVSAVRALIVRSDVAPIGTAITGTLPIVVRTIAVVAGVFSGISRAVITVGASGSGSAWRIYRSAAFTPESAVPRRSAVCIETGMRVVDSAVPATVFPKYAWPFVIEYTDMIAVVDREKPGPRPPIYRMKEIVGCGEQRVLPVVENMTQVCVPVGQVTAINVVSRADAH